MFDCALDYARRGWKVFPLFYVLRDGGCSCRKRNCKRIGKHPMTKNGVQDAATDELTIRGWWTETPFANIGLATGYDGLVVVDIDDGPLKKDGFVVAKKTGSETLSGLMQANAPLPKTFTVQTGSGGLHHYFRSAKEIPNSAGTPDGKKGVGPFIDVRGTGGYVILPPSNHEMRDKYKVLVDTPIAEMPAWLEAKAMGKKIDISGDVMDGNDDVVKHAKEKSPLKLSKDQLVKLLDFILPDCDRDTWWQVGAAL
jgi:putative DNA primase/helicase